MNPLQVMITLSGFAISSLLLITLSLRLLNEEEEKVSGSWYFSFCGSCNLQLRQARFYQKPIYSYMYFTIECPYIKWPSKNLRVIRMPVTFDVIKSTDDFDGFSSLCNPVEWLKRNVFLLSDFCEQTASPTTLSTTTTTTTATIPPFQFVTNITSRMFLSTKKITRNVYVTITKQAGRGGYGKRSLHNSFWLFISFYVYFFGGTSWIYLSRICPWAQAFGVLASASLLGKGFSKPLL